MIAGTPVSVLDFGAVGDGVIDDTAALKACFDYAIPLKRTVTIPDGTYKISGPIQPYATRTSGGLHINLESNVIIEVDSGSTAFSDVLYFATNDYNSASITGGILQIEGNDKAGRGISIRHNDSSGGSVNITAAVKIKNIKENSSTEARENSAMEIYGDYGKILVQDLYIESVQRTNTSAGATKGLSVSQFSGLATIENVYVKNVLTPSDSDADGIAVFGKTIGASASTNARAGVARVNNCVFIDCQGRSVKSQCSETTIYRPKVTRESYTSITNGIDFDFQLGGTSLLIEPTIEYYKLANGNSPLGASHACVTFQQNLSDKINDGKAVGGTVITEVVIPRYCTLLQQSSAESSYTEVSDLNIIPYGTLTTTALNRGIIEFSGGEVAAKSTETTVIVRNVRGPIAIYAIGYTNYTSGDVSQKLSFEVTDCHNTLNATDYRPFRQLSGNPILEVKSFRIQNNYGFISLVESGWTFNFNNLVPRNAFTVDIASVNATNAPSWGSSGYGFVEVLDEWSNGGLLHARVTVNSATSSNSVFFTQQPSSGWGTIK